MKTFTLSFEDMALPDDNVSLIVKVVQGDQTCYLRSPLFNPEDSRDLACAVEIVLLTMDFIFLSSLYEEEHGAPSCPTCTGYGFSAEGTACDDHACHDRTEALEAYRDQIHVDFDPKSPLMPKLLIDRLEPYLTCKRN